jgi:DnaJ-class molecular chaperone
MNFQANHRVRESCLICEGKGRTAGQACQYCSGSGVVFARTGAPQDILLATGDCKVPLRRKPAQGLEVQRNFS